MIELIIFLILGVLIVSLQCKTIRKLETLEKRTTSKFEIIYYMLYDVLGERQNKKQEGD